MKKARHPKKAYRAGRPYQKPAVQAADELDNWSGFMGEGRRTAEEERARLIESFREMGIGQV
jgi:hypothetical protein